MVCPLVLGDNLRALARGLSPVHVNNHGIPIFKFACISVGIAHYETFRASVGKSGISAIIKNCTTFTIFSMKYLVMCKVYTDVGGIKQLYHVCPPVRKIIHSLKLVEYLHVQADNPWYNYYIFIFQQ